jgi:hypothetical protein
MAIIVAVAMVISGILILARVRRTALQPGGKWTEEDKEAVWRILRWLIAFIVFVVVGKMLSSFK